MTGNEYQKSAMRTCRSPNLNHAVFGLCSEAGEVSGIMQKVFQGHKFDKNHLIKNNGYKIVVGTKKNRPQIAKRAKKEPSPNCPFDQKEEQNESNIKSGY